MLKILGVLCVNLIWRGCTKMQGSPWECRSDRLFGWIPTNQRNVEHLQGSWFWKNFFAHHECRPLFGGSSWILTFIYLQSIFIFHRPYFPHFHLRSFIEISKEHPLQLISSQGDWPMLWMSFCNLINSNNILIIATKESDPISATHLRSRLVFILLSY